LGISKENLNFTIVCRWSFPKDQGGIAMHNYYLYKSLKEEFNCNLVTLGNFYENEKSTNLKIVDFSLSYSPLQKIFEFSSFTKNGLRSLQDWRTSNAIESQIKTIKTDFIEFMDIHSEGYHYIKNNILSKNRPIINIRSHTPWGLLRQFYSNKERKGVDAWWAKKREKYCFNNCDTITTPSNDLKSQIIDLYDIPSSKITVLPNIIDTNHFIPISRKDNLDEQFVILHVGRFERAKGVITLIKAFIEFSKTINNKCKLINVGEPRGEAYNECIKLLKEANLIDQVLFSGFVSYDDLPKYYTMADLVIVPSEIYESFSYTVAQAMSCGKAVIASNIGGIPETLNYSAAGLVFKPGDSSSLTNKIRELYNDKRLRENLGLKGREIAVNNFSILNQKQNYTNFYKGLL
jgi:glycosyltransferase involved in cell wall biosynthesis